jgi:hypothetical protein
MEGYDTLLLANFFAQPQLAQKYGTLQPSGDYPVLAA